MRAKWGVALAALALMGSSAVAQAEPGRYGGGFIEFLMTGEGAARPGAPPSTATALSASPAR
jgi:hypothetical protein